MTNNTKMLVLDDDPVFSEVLCRSLLKRQYQTISANSLAQALSLCLEHKPDFTVLDLKLENESGLDCISPLLAINPDMKILILTGYSSIATAVNAMKLGAFDYACKPLDADAILLKLGLVKDKTLSTRLPDQPPSVDRLEWEHIQRILNDNEGNISATARSLGMHRRTLQRKLQKRPSKT